MGHTDPQDSLGAPEVFRASGAEAMSPACRAYVLRWAKMIDAEAPLMVEGQATAFAAWGRGLAHPRASMSTCARHAGMTCDHGGGVREQARPWVQDRAAMSCKGDSAAREALWAEWPGQRLARVWRRALPGSLLSSQMLNHAQDCENKVTSVGKGAFSR